VRPFPLSFAIFIRSSSLVFGLGQKSIATMARKSKKRSAEEAGGEEGRGRRLSSAAADSEEEAEDMEEEEVADEEEQEDVSEDPTSNDDEEENNDNGEAKSPFTRHNMEGRPAEVGIIKTIYMENFMCHRKYTMNFCRNVNFISGQNGSGKSAILAAIMICLGGSARSTHRASNLKDLVRKEAAGGNQCVTAKVSVTLWNGGDNSDGYRTDIYGKEITVVRCISLRGGYNGYKILDSEGREQSREKKELDDILDHLNIQVNNPVSILSQEDAKRFLLGKEDEKYRLFMKATELERIDNKYAATAEEAQKMMLAKDRQEEVLERKQADLQEKKARLAEFDKVEKYERKITQARVDFGWAFFAERDAEYENEKEVMLFLFIFIVIQNKFVGNPIVLICFGISPRR
jgi:hypothetical protein